MAHLNFGEPQRGWDFVSPGHGDVDFEAFFRALEPDRLLAGRSRSSGRTRAWIASGARRISLAFVRRTDFAPSTVAFDAAMRRGGDEQLIRLADCDGHAVGATSYSP